MNRQDKKDLVLLICLGILCIRLGYMGRPLIENNSFNLLSKTSIDQNSTCINLNLEETSNCLKNQLNDFYYYNISNLQKKLSFETLKEEGGVCWHYSEWYGKELDKLGINQKQISISFNRTKAHQFTVASAIDPNGAFVYCILDQTIIKCVDLG